MKILIVSDIHGDVEAFEHIVKNEPVDHIVSLGDSECSAQTLNSVDTIIHGNALMDFGQAVAVKTFKSLKVVMTHGHLAHVHRGDEGLIKLLKDHQAHLIMHGHTHVARFEYHPPYYLLNPGAIFGPRGSWPSSYALLTVESSTFTVTFKTLDQTIIKTEKGVIPQ
jgi:uncharacterized protein